MTNDTEQRAQPAARRPVDVDLICRWALQYTPSEPARLLYRPHREADGSGFWDAGAIARAVSLLLDEALAAAGPGDRVELSYRVQPQQAIVQIHDARGYQPGGRLFSLFDDDQTDAPLAAGREWIRAASEELVRQGATLSRVRSPRGSTWVIRLPRGSEPGVASAPLLRLVAASPSGEPG